MAWYVLCTSPFLNISFIRDAAYGTVETVYGSEKHSPGFGVFLLDVLFHIVCQRTVASLVALHDFAGILVDDDDVVVFVDNVHRLFIHQRLWRALALQSLDFTDVMSAIKGCSIN